MFARAVCGSLARGKDRPMRSGDHCECDEGWAGINCNVCTQNSACDALMETGSGGVCYQNGELVKNNHQICSVTNKKIKELLGDQKAEVTFTCEQESKECEFQCKYHIYACLTFQRSLFANVCVSLG